MTHARRVALLRVFGPEDEDGVRKGGDYYELRETCHQGWKFWYGVIRDAAGPDGQIMMWGGNMDATGKIVSCDPSPIILRGG